jgi:hypothetical protein
MEASGPARWFERFVAELQFELWMDDAAEVSTQAEDRLPGRATDPTFDAGESLPADLGAELGEPGSAATAVAPGIAWWQARTRIINQL